MATLYVSMPGARVEKEYQRLLVTAQDEVLMRVPIQRVSQVVLVGRVGVTTPALHALLKRDVSLMMVSRTGKMLGRLLPPTGANLPLRQLQYRMNDDPDFGLRFSRQVVAGKLRNQRVLALRWTRQIIAQRGEIPAKLAELCADAQLADSLATLRGIEGAGARFYFDVLRRSLNPDFEFARRTRRPPKDEVNALLSLGYTFLTTAMVATVDRAGLDPYLGYFHVEKYGRPALALDLVEEFRSPLVDSLVLTLLNKGMIVPEDFEEGAEEGGILLNADALSVFLREFTQQLERRVLIRSLGRRLSYRKLMEVQVLKLIQVLKGAQGNYEAFRVR